MTTAAAPGEDSPLAAMVSAGQVLVAVETLAYIRSARGSGASWAMIGRAQGGQSPKAAKRDAKRLKARTQRAWYLQQDQENQALEQR